MQRRGGKGRIGMRTREEDFVSHLFVASTHAYIMIFSDRGRAYWLKVHEIPDVGPGGKGKAIANLVSMEEGEKIAALLAVKEWPTEEEQQFVVMGTRKGVIKKTDLSAFSNPRAGGIIAMGVEEERLGDRGRDVRRQRADLPRHARRHGDPLRGNRRPADGRGRRMASAASRFATTTRWWRWKWCAKAARCSPSRRTATASAPSSTSTALQSRGGVGIINIQTSDRNGKVVGIAYVHDDDELMLISQQGKILRMRRRRHPRDRPGHAGRAADRDGRRRRRRLRREAGGEGRRGRQSRTATRPPPETRRRRGPNPELDPTSERRLGRLEPRVLRQQLLRRRRC